MNIERGRLKVNLSDGLLSMLKKPQMMLICGFSIQALLLVVFAV